MVRLAGSEFVTQEVEFGQEWKRYPIAPVPSYVPVYADRVRSFSKGSRVDVATNEPTTEANEAFKIVLTRQQTQN